MTGLFDDIAGIARGMGIVDISSASADLWDTDPLVSARIGTEARPKAILPSARSVIVIGIPMQKAIVDTAPSSYYKHLYDLVNRYLDQSAERIALELNILGHEAIYVPRDGYHGIAGLREIPASYFSQRHAAYLAGMGTFGDNAAIITKRYGPRIRFASVITSAEMPSPGPMKGSLCIHCKKCARACPVEAVSSKAYPQGNTKKQLCVERAAVLAEKGISPCGICIQACPVGEDRTEGPTEEALDNIRRY
jgi:epoxyqueuosine reductase